MTTEIDYYLLLNKLHHLAARKLMDRGKIVAIITGVISLILAIGYLLLVQLLDFRGEMIPAPVSMFYLGIW
ncbi:MAG: hypothetical protein WBV73_24475 [Phormidium sp.]